MKYKNPIPYRISSHKIIPTLWKHTNEWHIFLTKLIRKQSDEPLIPSNFMQSIKNIENPEQFQKELSIMVVVLLYFEIPYQMGCLELVKLNANQKKQFEKEQKKFSETIKKLQKHLKHLERLDILHFIDADFDNPSEWLQKWQGDIDRIHDTIVKRIFYQNIEDLEKTPKLVNPLFNTKQKSNVLRNLIMKYLALLFIVLEIEFSSSYQKNRLIYHILKTVLPAQSKQFNLMGNLQQNDIKNYLKNEDFSDLTLYYGCFSGMTDAIDDILMGSFELEKYQDIKYLDRLPIIYPYIKDCLGLENVIHQSVMFKRMSRILYWEYYESLEEN